MRKAIIIISKFFLAIVPFIVLVLLDFYILAKIYGRDVKESILGGSVFGILIPSYLIYDYFEDKLEGFINRIFKYDQYAYFSPGYHHSPIVSENEFNNLFLDMVKEISNDEITKAALSGVDEEVRKMYFKGLMQKASNLYERLLTDKLRSLGLYEEYMNKVSGLTDLSQLVYLSSNIPNFRSFLNDMIKTIKKEIAY